MIYYKEWIKTRWYLLLMFLATNGFAGYSILRLFRASELKGIAHIWEMALTRDSVFIEIPLQYIPIIACAGLALVQFIPEMHNKCLKLTLHLPYSPVKLLYSMIKFGLLACVAVEIVNIAVLLLGIIPLFAHEIYWRIILTSLPWFLAGIASYLLTSWVVLEPTWPRRIFNIVLSSLILRVYYLSSYPESYNSFLIYLSIFTLLLGSLSWLSVQRFKDGKQ